MQVLTKQIVDDWKSNREEYAPILEKIIENKQLLENLSNKLGINLTAELLGYNPETHSLNTDSLSSFFTANPELFQEKDLSELIGVIRAEI